MRRTTLFLAFSRPALTGLALFLTLSPGWAGTVLVQGVFPNDANVFLQVFTVNTTEQVTIESYGYAGGTVPTSPLPTTIFAGGFAPNAILFDATGAEVVSDNGGHCGSTGTDPETGNCDDPVIQQILGPGHYTLALTVWDNVPVDGLLSDGFVEDGNPGFTCAEFGLTGNFCDVTTALGVVRNGDYAVALTGRDITVVPEPSTLPLVLAGCLLGLLYFRRSMTKHVLRVLAAAVVTPLAVFAQIFPVTQDAYVVPGVATNFGSSVNITVGATSSQGLIQFDLSQLPSGTTGSQVQKATLTLFTNHVSSPGSMNVNAANGAWTESGVSGANTPTIGAAVAANVSIAAGFQFVSVDVTAQVQGWVNLPATNNGFILTANGNTSVQFDSKESTNTSHPATLTLVLANTSPAGPMGAPGPRGIQGVPGPPGTAALFGTNVYSFSQGTTAGAACTIGQVMLGVAVTYPTSWLPADGRWVPIAQYQALFTLIGNNYGGDGRSTLGLPNLTAAAPNGTAYYICAAGVYP